MLVKISAILLFISFLPIIECVTAVDNESQAALNYDTNIKVNKGYETTYKTGDDWDSNGDRLNEGLKDNVYSDYAAGEVRVEDKEKFNDEITSDEEDVVADTDDKFENYRDEEPTGDAVNEKDKPLKVVLNKRDDEYEDEEDINDGANNDDDDEGGDVEEDANKGDAQFDDDGDTYDLDEEYADDRDSKVDDDGDTDDLDEDVVDNNEEGETDKDEDMTSGDADDDALLDEADDKTDDSDDGTTVTEPTGTFRFGTRRRTVVVPLTTRRRLTIVRKVVRTKSSRRRSTGKSTRIRQTSRRWGRWGRWGRRIRIRLPVVRRRRVSTCTTTQCVKALYSSVQIAWPGSVVTCKKPTIRSVMGTKTLRRTCKSTTQMSLAKENMGRNFVDTEWTRGMKSAFEQFNKLYAAWLARKPRTAKQDQQKDLVQDYVQQDDHFYGVHNGLSVVFSHCLKRNAIVPDGTGTRSLCTECHHRKLLDPAKFYPNAFNEVVCHNEDNTCLVKEGACIQDYTHMLFRVNNGNHDLDELHKWDTYQQQVGVGCSCQLRKDSPLCHYSDYEYN